MDKTDRDPDPKQPPEPEKPLGRIDPLVSEALEHVLEHLSVLTWTQATNVLGAVRELISDRRPKGAVDW